MEKSIVLMAFAFFFGCTQSDISQEIIDKSISAHRMNALQGHKIDFIFRDKAYSVQRTKDFYEYTRSFEQEGVLVLDYLKNSFVFTRTQNGDTVYVTEEWEEKYASSINSVLYFFQVPYVLKDQAAKTKFVGMAKIKGQSYYSVQVTFGKENGGKDFDDAFVYWINAKDYLVDYFAYSYETDGGGVRFREAFNRVEKEGIVFQDYINYEVEKGISLMKIPEMFNNEELKRLSTIENQNIKVSHIH